MNDWVYGFCFSICDYCFNFWIINLFDLITIYYLSLWKVCVVLIIFCVFICFIFINLISFSFVVACLKCYFYFQKKQKIYNIVLIYLSFLYVLAIFIFNWKKKDHFMFHKTLESFFNHFNLIMFEVRIEFTSPFKYIKKMKLPLPTIFCRLCSRASFEDPSYNRSRYVDKIFSHFVLYMVSIYTEVHLKYELRPTVRILTGTVTVM